MHIGAPSALGHQPSRGTLGLMLRAGAGGGAGASFAVRDASTPAEIFLPGAGVLPLAVPGAAPNTLGALVAVGGPVANDFFVSSTSIRGSAIPAALANHHVLWIHGVGAINFDVDRMGSAIVDPTADAVGNFPFRSRAYGYRVPAGDQISAQAQASIAGYAGYYCSILGFDGAYPTWPTLPLTALPQAGVSMTWPTNLLFLGAVIAGLLPAFSAWQQIFAAAPGNGVLITEVIPSMTIAAVGATNTIAQIGIGAAGAEVACASVQIGMGAPSYELWPPVFVAPGLRAALRYGSSAAAARISAVKGHIL